jgi:hypothetical protein
MERDKSENFILVFSVVLFKCDVVTSCFHLSLKRVSTLYTDHQCSWENLFSQSRKTPQSGDSKERLQTKFKIFRNSHELRDSKIHKEEMEDQESGNERLF